MCRARFSVWPTEQDGWAGTPAQAGNRGGTATTPRPRLVDAAVEHDAEGGRIALQLDDVVAGTRARVEYRLDAAGVLSADLSIENDSDAASAGPYLVDGLRALLPLPDRATELLDFTGKWCRERAPQRLPFAFGTHARRARRGKPGHDSPYLLVAGTAGFGFAHGEVWGVHLALERRRRVPRRAAARGRRGHSRVIGARRAAALGRGGRCSPASATTPRPCSSRGRTAGSTGSRHGSTAASAPARGHPAHPRPLVLNTWEAVYFDHDLDRLVEIADRAAEVGVERIVLDDGWFRGRRDATAGLGDWLVDETVWPDGLGPFVEAVREPGHAVRPVVRARDDQPRLRPRPRPPRLGARAPARAPAPRRATSTSSTSPTPTRTHSCSSASARSSPSTTSTTSSGTTTATSSSPSRAATAATGRSCTRRRWRSTGCSTSCARRHPRLEIETCSGGGGRVDLGILDRTDRVWASDCNDPVERARIERWTRLLVPPELIGSHVGARRSHTTSRETDLSFRLAVALTAHAGHRDRPDRRRATKTSQTITAWSALYRELRGLLHTGDVVNADLADDADDAHRHRRVAAASGRCSPGRASTTSPDGQSGRVRFPGLDAGARYRVRVRAELGPASRHEASDPDWIE